MRYAEIIGKGFYGIKLSRTDEELVDLHFLGASHHWHRARKALIETPEFEAFHIERFRAHMRHLIEVVYLRGDFSRALDLSLRDLDERETWNPDSLDSPDWDMFDNMLPDSRFGPGSPHSSDVLLKNLLPNAVRPSLTGAVKLRLVGNT